MVESDRGGIVEATYYSVVKSCKNDSIHPLLYFSNEGGMKGSNLCINSLRDCLRFLGNLRKLLKYRFDPVLISLMP
jgi:hypothetical protein